MNKTINTNKNNRQNSRSRGRAFSAKQVTCRATGREFPYSAFTLHDRAGVLNAQSATPSATNGTYTDLNPNYFGSRCAQLARLYNKWRLRKLVVRYKPYAPLGVSATTYTGDFTRQFAAYAGFTLDPTVGSLSPIEVVECGGKEFNYGKGATWSLNNCPWLFTQPTVGDTLADLRFFSLGHFNAVRTEITGPADPGILWGDFEFDWDIEFSTPVDADSEAFSASRSVRMIHDMKASLEVNQKRFSRIDHPQPSIQDKTEQKSERDHRSSKSNQGWF